jgi:type III pantothenate kinase
MVLCLDVGNSNIFGGVFDGKEIKLRFRYASEPAATSDELGVFLKSVLRENQINPSVISKIAVSSVVPYLDYALRAACKKYFDIEPFVLSAANDLPIQIVYDNKLGLGSDRIANAIAAVDAFPGEPIIVASFGTATTLCAINEQGQYLGGAILPGFRLSRDSLEAHAAKLPPVEIIRPKQVIGSSTESSIQVGLYYSQLGAVKEMVRQMSSLFKCAPIVIGTGGFSHLLADESILSHVMPDLILEGLRLALQRVE